MLLNKLYAYFIADYNRSDAYVFYRYKLLLHASFLTSLFSLLYFIVSLTIGFQPGAYFMVFNVIGFLLIPFLMKTHIRVTIIGNLYVFTGTLAVVVIIFYSGGINSPVFPWLIAPPVLALLIVDRFYAIVWACISLTCLIIFFLYTVNGNFFPVRYNEEWKVFFMFLSSSGIILIVFTISLIFERSTINALDAVELQRKELQRSQQELAVKHRENLEKNEILAMQREELLATSDKLQELNEKKDYLMEILAHDLKSPLASTQLMIGLIKKDSFSPDSLELRIIDMIAESSRKSLGLIQKILNSENLESILYNLKIESVNIPEILETVIADIQRVASAKNITIDLKVSAGRSYDAWVDKIYVTQIFENLLSNAIKFSPLNKNIFVSVSEVKNGIRTEVKDEGPGISQDEMDMLFKKYNKLSNKPTGTESSTGLGLSIVKHYTELLKGKVWCESVPEKGCNFVVELPIHDR